MLNPELHPFCLGDDRKTVPLPIFFNATIPVEVELIRTDFETSQQESIKLTKNQIKEIANKAKREAQEGVQTAVQFDYPAKKPGAYQLGRVLDEYKLEVQRRNPQTFVVPCPKAWVGPSASPGRCIGDLSDLSLQVEGTPPLKIKYSRTINGKDHSFHFQSLQPEGFSSPLTGLRSASLIGLDDEDIAWARSQRVPVGLNESMHASGEWQYSVDEVQDGFGNLVKYDYYADESEGRPKPKHLMQNFVVKERPQVRLEGCDLRRPLKVAKGDSKELPVRFKIAGQTPDVTAHTLTWQFSPIDTLTESGDHGDVVSIGSYNAKNARDRPMLTAPGLYTLKSVSASECEGEVQEPSSCLLLNPLEPKLTVRSEEIPDTCAGNSIGLRVDMDLIGTPPFIVRYDVISNGQRRSERVSIPGLRYQMDLIPRIAGHHKYIFTQIGDDIYNRGQRLTGPEYVLEQDVKPAAAALIQHSSGKMSSCLGDEVTADILLLGDPPFALEWEIIHDGKRKQHKATDIQEGTYQIRTKPMTQGGEYTLGLTSVQDKRGCRNFLQDELKISVRRQSPRAAFGQVEGRRKMLAVEGSTVKLPVRLTGEGPWKVFYTNLNEGPADSPKILERTVRNDNGYLDVKGRGSYVITDVWDNQCHGVVDPKASQFEVDWFARPEMSVSLSHGVSQTDSGFVVEDVCEGDVSGFEVALQGKLTLIISSYGPQLTSLRHAAVHGGVRGPPPPSPGVQLTQQKEVRRLPRQGVDPGGHGQGGPVHVQVHRARGQPVQQLPQVQAGGGEAKGQPQAGRVLCQARPDLQVLQVGARKRRRHPRRADGRAALLPRGGDQAPERGRARDIPHPADHRAHVRDPHPAAPAPAGDAADPDPRRQGRQRVPLGGGAVARGRLVGRPRGAGPALRGAHHLPARDAHRLLRRRAHLVHPLGHAAL